MEHQTTGSYWAGEIGNKEIAEMLIRRTGWGFGIFGSLGALQQFISDPLVGVVFIVILVLPAYLLVKYKSFTAALILLCQSALYVGLGSWAAIATNTAGIFVVAAIWLLPTYAAYRAGKATRALRLFSLTNAETTI